MTKKEREAVQKHFNDMNNYRVIADEAFKKLQDLNAAEGTGDRWCCAQTNAIDLLKCGKDYMHIYNTYVEACAKADSVLRFGQDLADIGFWK